MTWKKNKTHNALLYRRCLSEWHRPSRPCQHPYLHSKEEPNLNNNSLIVSCLNPSLLPQSNSKRLPWRPRRVYFTRQAIKESFFGRVLLLGNSQLKINRQTIRARPWAGLALNLPFIHLNTQSPENCEEATPLTLMITAIYSYNNNLRATITAYVTTEQPMGKLTIFPPTPIIITVTASKKSVKFLFLFPPQAK